MKQALTILLLLFFSVCAAQSKVGIMDTAYNYSDSMSFFKGTHLTQSGINYNDYVTVYRDTTFDRYGDGELTLKTEYKSGISVDTIFEWNHFAYVCARAKRQHDYWYKQQDVQWKRWKNENSPYALSEFYAALVKAQYWMGVYDGMRKVLNKEDEGYKFDYEYIVK